MWHDTDGEVGDLDALLILFRWVGWVHFLKAKEKALK